MKKTLTLLFIALYLNASATTYYISSSGNDSASGLSESTPWLSINKVNSAFPSMKPGDRILFRSGDTFYGTLRIASSGLPGNPIVIGSYGSGPKPVITGFTTLSSWTNVGGGIYSASLTCESSPEMVTIDGAQFAMGRWPNSNVWPEPQTWASIDSYVGVTSITDADLGTTGINWTGAEVVVRNSTRNRISRYPITNHTGNTLTFSGGNTSYPLEKDWGYFVQNDKRTLDKFGEWYYDTKTSTFYMYFGTANPSIYSVKVTTINSLIIFDSGINYCNIDNLSLSGANNTAICGNWNNSVTIKNNIINFCGFSGILLNKSKYSNISNCIIDHCNDNGMNIVEDSDNAIIAENEVSDIGLFPGMGQGLFESCIGIFVRGSSNVIVEFNNLNNIGYTSIRYSGDYNIIRNNVINNYCFIKEDGGAISYASGATYSNMKILNNIVLNGLGSPAGKPAGLGSWVSGIYLDYYTTGGVEITGNTVAHVTNMGGILISGSQNVIIKNNTVFDCSSSVRMQEIGSLGSPVKNITMIGNIYFAKNASETPLLFYSISKDISQLGTFNYNYYARPLDNAKPITTGIAGVVTARTLADWQTLTGIDLNSKISPITLTNTSNIDFYYNPSGSDKTFGLAKPMIDVKGTKYGNSITLSPYTSAVLMVDPDPDPSEPAPVYLSASIPTYPTLMVINYSLPLANVVPSTSAFTVKVNSVPRNVESILISKSTVRLYLESGIDYGDVVTVSYTKPSNNFLQSVEGVPAVSIANKPVTHSFTGPPPVYVNSIIDTYPTIMVLNYDQTLANVHPDPSTFTVKINSKSVTINSILINGTTVRLYLENGAGYGDIVTVSYNKPDINPLQSETGIPAESISDQIVTNKIQGLPLLYESSSIPTYPTLMVMNYNQTLANIVPHTGAFTVMVNNVPNAVNSVIISGKTVRLYLENGVQYGDVVTVSYTKPSLNPVQSELGVPTESMSNKPVQNYITTNNPPPIYQNSIIPTYPTLMVMNYDQTLANIVPASSAFLVKVNSIPRNVLFVIISNSTVRLYLENGVQPGDIVTLSYTKPSINPLQSESGILAASVSNQPVLNNISASKSGNTASILNYEPIISSGLVYDININSFSDFEDDFLTYNWTLPEGFHASSVTGPKIRYLAPVINNPATVEFILSISDGYSKQLTRIPLTVKPYKPEMSLATIIRTEASETNYNSEPAYISDNNIKTKWEANGTEQWILLELANPMKLSHIQLAFDFEKASESYFEIYASKDNISWDAVLTDGVSCNFTGTFQTFDLAQKDLAYSFMKLVSRGNSVNNSNYFSEIRIFGLIDQEMSDSSETITIYPNPTRNFINILNTELSDRRQTLNIFDLTGRLCLTYILEPDIHNTQIPIQLMPGIYYVKITSGNQTILNKKLVVTK